MDITTFDELLELLELVIRRKAIILELYPNKRLTQSELSERTGIAMPNISTYIKKMKENEIIDVKNERNSNGNLVNFVQLRLRTINLLDDASKILVTSEKKELTDLIEFEKILKRLINPIVQRHAADSIQILSRQYIIPQKSGFFTFLEQHMDDNEIRPVLVTLIKSTRNIVGDLNPDEKERVLAELGSKLQTIAEKKDSQALKNETLSLLKELGAYDLPFEDLRNIYLKQRFSENDPTIFRSIILRNHRDKLLDLWNSMMDLYESASEAEKAWFDQEFALLR